MSNYTEQEKFSLLKQFHEMDANGDGYLSVDEIQQVLERSQLPPEKFQVEHFTVLCAPTFDIFLTYFNKINFRSHVTGPHDMFLFT